MSRYKTKNYSNRREYLDWLAERYGVDRADVVLLALDPGDRPGL